MSYFNILFYLTVILGCVCSIMSYHYNERERTLQNTALHLKQNIRETRRAKVKQNTPMQKAFDDIDANFDGHITAQEFALYYATNFPILDMSETELQKAFNAELPEVDTNYNGKLELEEFEISARKGGHF